MAATTYTQEMHSSLPPEKLFKALIIDGHSTMPKALPNAIKSIESHAGKIKKTNYTHGAQLKVKIGSVDADNLTCKFTLIEGEMLGDKFESISYDLKFERSSNGGSIIKGKVECLTKGAINCSSEIIEEKGKATELFKAAEEYLLKNPSIYA